MATEIIKGVNMPNFVRACFCFDQPLKEEQFSSLLVDWTALSCRYKSSKNEGIVKDENKKAEIRLLAQQFIRPLYSSIELNWTVLNQAFRAEFSQIWHSDRNVRRIIFSVEEKAFFHTDALEVYPEENGIFSFYKELIIQFLQHLKPVIGMLDFEADLDCDRLIEKQSFASWGNYFSTHVIQYWDAKNREFLPKIVDSFIHLPDLGVLTFIQPLAQNQAWTHRHAKLEELIKKNMYFTPSTT
jgi:hypothetical protein